MPPKGKGKPNPNEPVKTTIVRTFVFAGEKNLPPSMSQKMGALRLNGKKVGEEIAKKTKAFKGIRVFVEIHVTGNQFEIVMKPGTSALLIKEMGGYERDKKKPKIEDRTGDLPLEKVKKIAKMVEEEGKSQSKDFKGTLKQVLGTCLSIGYTVDGQNPKDLQKAIDEGTVEC